MAFQGFSRFFGRASDRIGVYSPFIRRFSYTLWGFAVWVPACMFFNKHVARIGFVEGSSMYPYLNPDYHRNQTKDVIWESRWNPRDGLRRGMIVTFWSPHNPNNIAIKRVIALEGDKVVTRGPYPYPIAEVPPGHVWVEGDGGNGGQPSLDSHYYGPIAISLIFGRVTHVVYPWKNSGPIRWWEFRGKTKVIQGNPDARLTWG